MALTNVFYALIYGTGFGIANTLIIIVAQRTREIGILKAMGASQKSIMAVFLSVHNPWSHWSAVRHYSWLHSNRCSPEL
jgi:hypothetical protein